MRTMGEQEDASSDNSEPPPESFIDDENDAPAKLEAWVDWIKRATAAAEAELGSIQIEDWCKQQRRRQWRWAGHVTRRSDGRWTVKIWKWAPVGGSRRVGRPNRRWSDEIDEFLTCVEDERQKARLHYMVGHAGECIDEGTKKKGRARWREVWKRSEDHFVDFADHRQ